MHKKYVGNWFVSRNGEELAKNVGLNGKNVKNYGRKEKVHGHPKFLPGKSRICVEKSNFL